MCCNRVHKVQYQRLSSYYSYLTGFFWIGKKSASSKHNPGRISFLKNIFGKAKHEDIREFCEVKKGCWILSVPATLNFLPFQIPLLSSCFYCSWFPAPQSTKCFSSVVLSVCRWAAKVRLPWYLAACQDCLGYPGTKPDACRNPEVYLWLLKALVGLLNLTVFGTMSQFMGCAVLCWTCNLKPCFKMINLCLLSPCLLLFRAGNIMSRYRNTTATLQPNRLLREVEGSRQEEQNSQSTEGTWCDNSRTVWVPGSCLWIRLRSLVCWALAAPWKPDRFRLRKKRPFIHTESACWKSPPSPHLSLCFPPLSPSVSSSLSLQFYLLQQVSIFFRQMAGLFQHKGVYFRCVHWSMNRTSGNASYWFYHDSD